MNGKGLFLRFSDSPPRDRRENTLIIYLCSSPDWTLVYGWPLIYIYTHTWPILIVSPSYEPPFLQCHSLLQIQAKPAPSNSHLLLYYI